MKITVDVTDKQLAQWAQLGKSQTDIAAAIQSAADSRIKGGFKAKLDGAVKEFGLQYDQLMLDSEYRKFNEHTKQTKESYMDRRCKELTDLL